MEKPNRCREISYGVLDEVRAAESPGAKAKKKTGHRTATAASTTRQRRKQIEDGQVHIKEAVLKNLDPITKAMLAKAKNGGTAPLKLLWELGKMHQDATSAPKRREATLSELLMRELSEGAAAKKAPAPRK